MEKRLAKAREKDNWGMKGKKHSQATKIKMSQNYADVWGDKNPAWKGGLSPTKCADCGNIIYRKSSQLKRVKDSFCNVKCFARWKRKNLTGERSPSFRGGKIAVKCEICVKVTLRIPAKLASKHYFCSQNCRLKWLNRDQRGKKNRNYLNGESFEPYTSEFNKELKELIRLRDKYKCRKCGCPEIENGEKLSVHHIDYNKKNCLPSNLIALCRRCNAEVNKNREFWICYFREKLAKTSKEKKYKLTNRF